MEYNIRIGPIRQQISTSIKVILFFLLGLTILRYSQSEIRDFEKNLGQEHDVQITVQYYLQYSRWQILDFLI